MLALSALLSRVSVVAREASVDEDEGGEHVGDVSSSRSTSNGVGVAATHWCEACDRSMLAHQRRQHEQGRAHRKKVSETNANAATYWCEACDVIMNIDLREVHESSFEHREKARAPEAAYRCEVCDVPVPAGGRAFHESGSIHQNNVNASSGDASAHHIKLIQKDGVVAVELKVSASRARQTVRVRLGAKPVSNFAKCVFSRHEMREHAALVEDDGAIHVRNAFHLRDSLESLPLGLNPVSICVEYEILRDAEEHRGYTKVVRNFMLRREGASETKSRENLGPNAPYSRPRDKARIGQVVVNPPPPDALLKAITKFSWPTPCSEPDKMCRRAALGTETQRAEIAEFIEAERGSLSMTNYGILFRKLLMLEELQMQLSIRQYDMVGVQIEKRNRLYRIFVPGLIESRPSLLRGDRILVTLSTNPQQTFRGRIEHCEMEHILVEFARVFDRHYIAGSKADVRFETSRVTTELLHDSLKKVASYESHIFPTVRQVESDVQPPAREMTFLSRDLNDEQKVAVKSAMSDRDNCPFTIFGPPGTGKTTTVVEIVAQMYRAGKRVMIMAPSNNACDLFLQRVMRDGGVPKSQVLRVYGYSRSVNQVPSSLLEVSNFDAKKKCFESPHPRDLSAVRILAMTPMTAARLTRTYRPYRVAGKPYKEFVLTEQFDDVVIDEAGHASEPELVAAMTSALNPKSGNLVLAGDPRQLGPLISSKLAASLDVSLLERLCVPPSPYGVTPHCVREDGGYDARVVCMLTKNYRSHSSIISLPSRLFYFDKLRACADPMTVNRFTGWDELPNPNFPCVFHGVVGKELRESSSPSWFNPDEILVAGEWISKVLNKRGSGITASDIAVVTPYHKQKLKMKRFLDEKLISGVTVGSTEMLQGSEYAVVLITTTRSSVPEIGVDKKHQLGFMSNPKRFNVAITRAKALLVVIGNPFTLAHDEHWRSLLDHCRSNDSYCGVEFDDADVDDANAAADDGADDDERAYEIVNYRENE